VKEYMYIFDIDGCIMPAIISNSDDNNHTRKKIVKESINKGQKIKLYPDFINYYKKHCERAKLVVFITGRKKSEFGSLTEVQLKPLNKIQRYQIIYYPEGKGHKLDEYFEWKVKKIEEILEDLRQGRMIILGHITLARRDQMDETGIVLGDRGQ